MRFRSTPRHAALLLAPALAAVLILGACGDDDDTSAADSTASPATTAAPDTTAADTSVAAGGNVGAFCSNSLELEAAAAQSPEGDGEDVEANKAFAASLLPYLADLSASAPPEAKAVVDEVMVPEAEAAAESGDVSAFETPEFNAALLTYHGVGVAECGWTSTDVDMQDYHFIGMPDSLTAGVHSFELSNSGQEPHVMIVVRKNEGVTETFEELLALPEEEAMTKVTMIAEGFAAPGDGSYVLADLEPGEYLAFCPLPVGWVDMSAPPPDGPPHFVEGMAHEFTVS